MRTVLATLAVISATLALVGCATSPSRASLQAQLVTDWSPEDYQYRIGAGDELGIRFPVNPDLNAEVTVGPDGRAVLPLVAGVKVGGLTTDQADVVLSDAYAKVLRHPIVNTVVYNYIAGQVYVAGEVKDPGAKLIRGEMTATQAVFAAGGLSETARTHKVVVLRHRADGRVLMRTIDTAAAMKGEPGADIRVFPGDMVWVPRSQISEFDRIVRQYITNALPFNLNYELSNNASVR